MTTELYLKLPGRKPIRVSVTGRRVGSAVVLDVTAQAIRFQLIGQPADFVGWTAPVAEGSPKTAMLPAQRPNVLAMSAADVLDYFRKSPILSIYADDLRTGVLKPLEAATGDFQLQNDIRAVDGLQNPSQADIAECLFGDRSKTGGSYRRRILAVLSVLDTTTTMPEVAATPVGQKKAA